VGNGTRHGRQNGASYIDTRNAGVLITGLLILFNEPGLSEKERMEFGARFHLLPVGEELLDQIRIHV
jgi:hypothetical protein